MDNEISRYLKVFEWVRCPEVEDIDGRKIIYLSRGYFKDTNKRLIYLGEDLFPVAKYDQMKNRYWSSQKLRSFLDFDPKEGFKKIHLEKSLKPKKLKNVLKKNI